MSDSNTYDVLKTYTIYFVILQPYVSRYWFIWVYNVRISQETHKIMKWSFRSASVVSGSALLLGFAWVYLFDGPAPGVNVPLYVALLVGGGWAASRWAGKAVRFNLWLISPLAFFGLMAMVRSSEMLTVLNIFACLVLLLIITADGRPVRANRWHWREWFSLPLTPLNYLEPFGQAVSALSQYERGSSSTVMTKRVLVGVIVAVPLLVVFGSLFATADPVFAKYARELFNFHVDPTVLRHLLQSLVVAAFVLGALGFMMTGARREAAERRLSRPFGDVEVMVTLGLVALLFGAFILIQVSYLFGGAQNIGADGLTYADYARRGFFELLTVGVLTLGVLSLADRFTKQTDRGHRRQFVWLGSVLVGEVLVILASSFQRLWLYEEAYGFSDLRLYSHAFTVLLAVIFALFVVKLWRNLEADWWLWRSFGAAVVALMAVNLANPDATIARLNLARYEETGKLDISYLVNLSPDAVPVTAEFARGSGDVPAWVRRDLHQAAETRGYDETRAEWQSYNLGWERAVSELKTVPSE